MEKKALAGVSAAVASFVASPAFALVRAAPGRTGRSRGAARRLRAVAALSPLERPSTVPLRGSRPAGARLRAPAAAAACQRRGSCWRHAPRAAQLP
jgi:hypothetical protein